MIRFQCLNTERILPAKKMNINDLIQEFVKLKLQIKTERFSICKYNQTKLKHKDGEWECDIIFGCADYLGRGYGKTPEEAFIQARTSVLNKTVILSEKDAEIINKSHKNYLNNWHWYQM